MKIKVAELEGARLDYWVAKALGWKMVTVGRDVSVWVQENGEGRFRCGAKEWGPSTNWEQGGPIIEHLARIGDGLVAPGRTPLLAAMRCFVASRFGEEVEE